MLQRANNLGWAAIIFIIKLVRLLDVSSVEPLGWWALLLLGLRPSRIPFIGLLARVTGIL